MSRAQFLSWLFAAPSPSPSPSPSASGSGSATIVAAIIAVSGVVLTVIATVVTQRQGRRATSKEVGEKLKAEDANLRGRFAG
jgi:hypothetical protein